MPFDYRNFIRKYNLNGLVEDVRWLYHGGVLRVFEFHSSKKLLVDVNAPCEDYPNESRIVLTGGKALFNKMHPLEMPAALSIEKDYCTKLIFEDGRSTLEVNSWEDESMLVPQSKNLNIPVMEYNRTLLTQNFIKILKEHQITKRHSLFRFSPGRFSFNGYHLLEALKANRECQTFNLKTSQEGLAIATFFCASGWLARYFFTRMPNEG